MNTFVSKLKARHLFNQSTEISPVNYADTLVGYVGFDATASSLHVGHLLPIMMLRWLQELGGQPIVLVGGATTLVGDPSGKDQSRPLLSKEIVQQNVENIERILMRFLKPETQLNAKCPIFVNNSDWTEGFSLMEVLERFGRQMSINQMIKRESVKLRLQKEDAFSFLEFNYQLLQSIDYVILNEKHNCNLQMGGSDQWGNIVSGVNLVHRINKNVVAGITCPLIMRSDGKKMGKSEDGAVWLDPELFSRDAYHHYWLNTPKADVERFLMMFTDLDEDEAREICKSDISEARKILADRASNICHGE